MRELGLVPCQARPWRPTTTVAGDAGSTPDLVLRDFTCETPASKLVGDNTNVPADTWAARRPGWKPAGREVGVDLVHRHTYLTPVIRPGTSSISKSLRGALLLGERLGASWVPASRYADKPTQLPA